MREDQGRALIGTYQSLGLYRGDMLTLLKPVGLAESYVYDRFTGIQTSVEVDELQRQDAIAFYQSASENYDHYRQLTAGTRSTAER